MSALDDPRGREVDDLAWQAEQRSRAGEHESAQQLYARAAAIEQEIAESACEASARVRSVLAVSAVALWYKAARWAQAERLAHRWLADADLSDDARDEIRDLLQRCWVEAQLEPELLSTTLPLELRLVGGAIRRGLAPARIVRKKQATLVAMLERIAEWKLGRPYRKGGRSSFSSGELEILQAPARAASYGLRLYLRSTIEEQGKAVETQALLEHFFNLVSSPLAELDTQFGDPSYQDWFASNLRDLCADGDQVADVIYSSPSWRVRLPEVHLGPDVRRRLDERISARQVLPKTDFATIEGILNTVRLTEDQRYIEILDINHTQSRIALSDGDHLADIGSLLNKLVRASTRSVGRELTLERLESLDQAELSSSDE